MKSFQHYLTKTNRDSKKNFSIKPLNPYISKNICTKNTMQEICINIAEMQWYDIFTCSKYDLCIKMTDSCLSMHL